MKKIIALLLAVMMVLAMAACAAKTTDTPAPAETDNKTDAVQESDDLFHCEIPPKLVSKRKVPFVIVFYHAGNERTSKKRFQSREKHL